MPNQEHIDILMQGVDVWNHWRRGKPDVRPDLRKVDLHEANLFGSDVNPYLSHVDLHDAVLFDADLSRVNLRRANLRNSDLRSANLSGANLQEANLNGALLMKADLQSANLSGAILMEANLYEVNLSFANLSDADLSGAFLWRANLNEANLTRATLRRAILRHASFIRTDLSKAILSDGDLSTTNLKEANLKEAQLHGAFISKANLTEADLTGANLKYSRLVEVNLENAIVLNCSIYGISAWDLNLEGATQSNLLINRPDEPTITVDNIEVGQFIYLLLNNQKIRDVINTITSKAVLILGRFTPKRKECLEALREVLRRQGYLPILFDFDKPSSRNLSETVTTLAHIARFVIADITDAKSIPQELQRIIPGLPSLPVQPLLLSSEYEYGMFEDLLDYPWVLPLYKYDSPDHLIDSLEEKVILPAASKAKEIEVKRKKFELDMKQ
jgi:uncharacterized protein YjbI with pentapeptide repeats